MKPLFTILALTAVLAASCQTAPSAPQPRTEPSEAQRFVRSMGVGWNLGNTLEACGDWIDKGSITNYEVGWGNPLTTRQLLHSLKATGIRSVRIPVAWSNRMAEDFTIDPALLARVEEVAGWVLAEDMTAVVNLHWDGGWIAGFPDNYDKCMAKYRRIWEQVAGRFREAPDRLVLESLNEEGCFNTVWSQWGGGYGAKKRRAYEILHNMNQSFVDVVRASGGENARRYLLIAGYATDIGLTCDEYFQLPDDPAGGRLIVSVHYYTPAPFTILEKDASWGKAARSWGTAAEAAVVRQDFAKVKRRFLDKGIPVILGEYGTTVKNKDPDSVHRYIGAVSSEAWSLGICPMFWDNGEHYDRQAAAFRDPWITGQFQKLAALESAAY